jgi:hypothetical protein
VWGVEVVIPLKEEYKMESRSMAVMIVNIDGGMKKESTNIMIFGMILSFISRQSEKYALTPAKTRKAFTNIFKDTLFSKKKIIDHDQFIW